MADEQPDVAGPSPLISLAEAARLTGRHPEALRALVRRGRLTAQRGNNGRLLLRVADLPVTLPADLPNPAAAEHQAAERPATAGHVADLEILVGDLRDELLEAHLRIGRLEAERDAATGLSEARMDAVRAQVVAKEERIVELKALLADARRPWWRKLVGALLLAGSLSVVGTPALAQSNGMELLAPASSLATRSWTPCRRVVTRETSWLG